MSNDNKKTKNNAPYEEKQEARELTPDELAKVNGGAVPGFGAYGKEVKKKDVDLIGGPHGVGKTVLLKMLSGVDID